MNANLKCDYTHIISVFPCRADQDLHPSVLGTLYFEIVKRQSRLSTAVKRFDIVSHICIFLLGGV